MDAITHHSIMAHLITAHPPFTVYSTTLAEVPANHVVGSFSRIPTNARHPTSHQVEYTATTQYVAGIFFKTKNGDVGKSHKNLENKVLDVFLPKDDVMGVYSSVIVFFFGKKKS